MIRLKGMTKSLTEIVMDVAKTFKDMAPEFSDTFYIPDPQKFMLQELAHPDIIAKYGIRTWQFFDPKALLTQVALRDHWKAKYDKPTICNDYVWDGKNKNRGLRLMDWGGIDNRSPHKHGCGFDNKVPGVDSEELRKDIIENPDFPAYQFITRIELNTSHIHWDTFNIDDRIYTFEPPKDK